ncbi:MAG: hypothetical protein ACLT0Y_01785 [Christensenellales bacterium]
MIRCGTTCYNDMYFFTEQEIRAVEQTGIRSVLTRSTVCQNWSRRPSSKNYRCMMR